MDEEDGVVVAKEQEEEEEEKTTMTIQPMKRQVIIHLGAVEEERMLEQMKGGMTNLILSVSIFINLAIMLQSAIMILMVLKKELIFSKKKKVKSQSYCWHSKKMKRMTKTLGTWTTEQAIACVATKKNLWKRRSRVMIQLETPQKCKLKEKVPFS